MIVHYVELDGTNPVTIQDLQPGDRIEITYRKNIGTNAGTIALTSAPKRIQRSAGGKPWGAHEPWKKKGKK